MAKKVLIALSGGVDSSVAAYLLLKEGFNAVGITMDILNGGGGALTDAAKTADFLGIEHYSLDLSAQFDKHVIEPFIREYLSGRTPNPCVLCNKNIKWGMLLEKAEELDCDYIATGHYANIVRVNGRYSLKRAAFSPKDQTYALYCLSQKQLSKTIFPLGQYSKCDVRKIAGKAGLQVSDKPESQDICFVEDKDYARFINERAGKAEQRGEFVLTDGTVLGIHGGISNYTIGQRKGLGISYSEPLFVQRLDVSNNRIVLGNDNELYTSEFAVKDVNYLSVSDVNEEIECCAKIRYSHKGALCTVSSCGDGLKCRFNEPQRAITPGQSAVFYDEDGIVIAGGIIA